MTSILYFYLYILNINFDISISICVLSSLIFDFSILIYVFSRLISISRFKFVFSQYFKRRKSLRNVQKYVRFWPLIFFKIVPSRCCTLNRKYLNESIFIMRLLKTEQQLYTQYLLQRHPEILSQCQRDSHNQKFIMLSMLFCSFCCRRGVVDIRAQLAVGIDSISF